MRTEWKALYRTLAGGSERFAPDSLLEGAGFEPSVPRDTTRISRPAYVACACSRPTEIWRCERDPRPCGRRAPSAGPMVRIPFPPAESQANHRFRPAVSQLRTHLRYPIRNPMSLESCSLQQRVRELSVPLSDGPVCAQHGADTILMNDLERARGFEPPTPTLARAGVGDNCSLSMYPLVAPRSRS
jgi:hypothetical protein